MNFTLFLIICVIGTWRGIDPCTQVIDQFMTLAGITGMNADVTRHVSEGPPLKADFEIKLADGRVITVLANGGININ